MSPLRIKTEGEQAELIPAGVHRAVCYLVADLGTQVTPFKDDAGNPKKQHQLVLGWECPDFRIDYKGKDCPRAMSRVYTASMWKSNLRKDLEGWRGAVFSDDEANQFDLNCLLGQACMLQIMHKTAKTGKVYANVAAVMPLIKGTEKPEVFNEPQYFSLTEDKPIPDNIPAWIADKIEKSAEYQMGLADGPPAEAEEPPVVDDEPPAVEDDDLPF